MGDNLGRLSELPRTLLAHTPTPIEHLPNLSAHLAGASLYVKRDDCTGLAFGGNKSRQLEYYIGHALSLGADTLLTTGAVQSNHVRMTVAAARKMGLDIEVQLEQRVARDQVEYQQSGNAFLIKLLGAKIFYYPQGEDEDGADDRLYQRAEALRKSGKSPYVIPLANVKVPYGALGYVEAAEELLMQFKQLKINPSAIVLPTGSASTHAGLLTGLRLLKEQTPVIAYCVRRDASAQKTRVKHKLESLAELMEISSDTAINDIICRDDTFYPSYGLLNPATEEAIKIMAQTEGILLDPTYSGKAFAGLLHMVKQGEFTKNDQLVFLHTGGAPALFAYPELVD